MSEPDQVNMLVNDTPRGDSPTILAARAAETVPTVVRYGTATRLPRGDVEVPQAEDSPSLEDPVATPHSAEHSVESHEVSVDPVELEDKESMAPKPESEEEYAPEDPQPLPPSEPEPDPTLAEEPRQESQAQPDVEPEQPAEEQKQPSEPDLDPMHDEVPPPPPASQPQEPPLTERPTERRTPRQKPAAEPAQRPQPRAQGPTRPGARAGVTQPQQRQTAGRSQQRDSTEARAQPRRTTTFVTPGMAQYNARNRREPSRVDVGLYSNAGETISQLENRVYELTTENQRLTADLRGMRRVQDAQEKQLMALTDRLAEPEREADSLRNELRAVREQLRREHQSYLELEKETRLARRENQLLRRRVTQSQATVVESDNQEGEEDRLDSLAKANVQMEKAAPPPGSDPQALQDAARRVIAAAGESPEHLLEVAEVRRRLGSYSLDLAAADASMREARRVVTILSRELHRDPRSFISRINRAGEEARNSAQQSAQVHFSVAGAAQDQAKRAQRQGQPSPAVREPLSARKQQNPPQTPSPQEDAVRQEPPSSPSPPQNNEPEPAIDELQEPEVEFEQTAEALRLFPVAAHMNAPLVDNERIVDISRAIEREMRKEAWKDFAGATGYGKLSDVIDRIVYGVVRWLSFSKVVDDRNNAPTLIAPSNGGSYLGLSAHQYSAVRSDWQTFRKERIPTISYSVKQALLTRQGNVSNLEQRLTSGEVFAILVNSMKMSPDGMPPYFAEGQYRDIEARIARDEVTAGMPPQLVAVDSFSGVDLKTRIYGFAPEQLEDCIVYLVLSQVVEWLLSPQAFTQFEQVTGRQGAVPPDAVRRILEALKNHFDRDVGSPERTRQDSEIMRIIRGQRQGRENWLRCLCQEVMVMPDSMAVNGHSVNRCALGFMQRVRSVADHLRDQATQAGGSRPPPERHGEAGDFIRSQMVLTQMTAEILGDIASMLTTKPK